MPFNTFVEIHSPRNSAKADLNRLFDGGSSYGRSSYKMKQRYHRLKSYLDRFGAEAAECTEIESQIWEKLQIAELKSTSKERLAEIATIANTFPIDVLVKRFLENLPPSFQSKEVKEEEMPKIHEFIRSSIIAAVFTKHDNQRNRPPKKGPAIPPASSSAADLDQS